MPCLASRWVSISRCLIYVRREQSKFRNLDQEVIAEHIRGVCGRLFDIACSARALLAKLGANDSRYSTLSVADRPEGL